MYKVLSTTDKGVVQYAITELSDLELLPKKGITVTSTAILINPELGLKVFMFYDADGDKSTEDGQWIEI